MRMWWVRVCPGKGAELEEKKKLFFFALPLCWEKDNAVIVYACAWSIERVAVPPTIGCYSP